MIRPRLLCVDDDAGVRELYRTMFGCYGYDVVLAEDGHCALKLFRSQKFHGVVVDHEMPGLKGSEVAALLKHESPATPVVMVSGYPWTAEDAPVVVDAVIPKGTAISTLVDKLAMLLASRATPVQRSLPLARFLPLGSALAAAALVGFLVPRFWR
jgi:CheY-like chemotaxis protein